MNTKELYNHITKYLTPEEALMKLLEGSLIEYEKLKFDDQNKAVHPVIIISMAVMDLGWQMAIEKDQDEVRGMIIGTMKYLNSILK